MRKKVNQILNIIMGSFIGIFIGSGLYKYWHFRKYPGLYAMQSAPWYTSIFINGLFTLLLTVCMIVKVILIEKIPLMKKIAFILGIIFLFLTSIGCGYVIINHGLVNAGYAVVPGLWCMIFFSFYRRRKHD